MLLCLTLSLLLLADGGLDPLEIQKPLIAHWKFDESFGEKSLDASGNGCHASPQRGRRGVQRVDGPFAGALQFSGSHMLCVPEGPRFGTLPAISLSAWTKPEDLGTYKEIFRKEDGERRVLFSFQHDGMILSLGLNIDGYVECDAPLDPARVLDGMWHHCAATFDGRMMRVYLDGKEIGSLERPGVIAAGGPAPGCIGSSNGGECFQGGLDDLRIYGDSLTAGEIARLHQNGLRAIAQMSMPVNGGEPEVAKPLWAHWTFNERGGSAVIQDIAGDPAVNVEITRGASRRRGVHGNALHLSGNHQLAAGIAPPAAEVERMTFTAWVKPADLKGFREIFRQECPSRLLFSFQENGTILSLGLNVRGYVECDAAIQPGQVLDGMWHHAAATFDGRMMRVYLDGKEIGSLERPGRITTEKDIPAFIGSSSGSGEFFQGGLDDLRIYREALTQEEIALLYRKGMDSLAAAGKELEEAIQAFYSPAETFAETLAACRRNLREKDLRLDGELADVVVTRLRGTFPEEFQQWFQSTGSAPAEYLLTEGNQFHLREVGRLVEMMLEYKPLTASQWRCLPAGDHQKWKEAEAIQNRFEDLKAQGEAAQFSPEWIRIALEAGKRISHRPRVSEAVAPYVTPQTPETRNLTDGEAREALERDWLHQADRNPAPGRIQKEIQWARNLAARIQGDHSGGIDFSKELAALERLEKQAALLSGPDQKLYFEVREVKREIAFKNPAVDFDKVLFVDMPFPAGSEWPHQTRHRLGYMAVPGGRLLTLEGLSPAGKLKQLMPQPPLHGSFWRPDLSFDAHKVLFCFKPHNEKAFHLFEIGADGTGLTQLTSGPFDDLDPIYLPDGRHIIFSTTRGHTYVRCMPPTNAYVLARCDRQGKNIYLISLNNEPDYLPSVMDDGRIIYTRWEYTDKPLWRAQGLWTVNPDGTQVNTFWGNQSVWPDLLKDARSIPGSRRVLFTGSAHHNWFSGSVGIIDPGLGFNFPQGLTKVTADVPWPESGNGPVDPVESPHYHSSGRYAAYYSPYPLSETDFIVSANRGGKFVLYLMDVDGNRELIYEGANNIFHALPLKPRRRPPVIADRVAWPDRSQRHRPESGVLFSGNVYSGAPPALQGKARHLRVLNIENKTYTYWHKRPYLSTGPVVSAVQSEGVKRVLGTVPIETDGSVAFHVPAGISVHFQLLDENHRALQTMRSFTGVMPGEERGCLGCHELHSTAPPPYPQAIALSKEPRKITTPPWGEDSVSYERYVQPVLDRYCGKCHQGEGEAREVLDLTDRPGFLIFSEPYLFLTGRPSWGRAYVRPKDPPPGFGIANMIMVEGYDQRDPVAYRTPKPMTYLSYKSKLVEISSSGKHHDVKVDPISLRRLIVWIDTMCPYRGDQEVRAIEDPVFQGVDWLSIRPRIKSAPTLIRPGPVDDWSPEGEREQ